MSSSITNFITSRLANFNSAGEGSSLPPRQYGDLRVPLVTNLRVAKVENFFGGSAVTLTWDDPEYPNIAIRQFNIFVIGIDGIQRPQGPYSAARSPGVVRITTSTASRLICIVQTQLTSGLTSPLELSPTVTVETIEPVIDSSSLGPTGVTPGSYGGNAKYTSFTVNSDGRLSAASSGIFFLDRLRLPVRVESSGPYDIVGTDFLVIGNTTSGSFTVNLPAIPNQGDTYTVKKSVAANTLTIGGNGKNIDGSGSVALTTQYSSRTVIYNGTEWSVISTV